MTGAKEQLYDYDEAGNETNLGTVDPRSMDLAEIEEELQATKERVEEERARQKEERERPAREKSAREAALAAEKEAFAKKVAYERKLAKALKSGSNEPED